MKKSLLTLLLLTFCFELASSKLLFFDPHSKEYITNLETNKTSISVIPDSLGITVNYSLGTIGFIACDSVESAYSIQLEDFGSSFDCLMPDLPSRIDNFKIPSDVYDIKVSLKEFEYVMCNVPICTGTEPIPCFTKDIKITPKAATTSTTLESDSIIKINYFINKRRNNHLGILISPFQYDADNNQLNIYKTFTYRVDFIYNKKQNKAIIEDNSNKDYLSIPVRESFLIISTPDYKNTIKPFAKWKQQCGFNVIEKYESTWNSNRTKSVIDSIYQNTDNLKYVLFVGDNSIVPGHYLSFDGWSNYPQWGIRYYYSDFPYSCIDNSIIPDLHIGRIPSRNLSEADNAISKILSYELSPTLSSNFYDRTLHNAIFTLDDNSIEYAKEPFVYTSEKIRDYVSSLGYNCIRNYSAPNYAMPKYWAKRYGLGEEIPKELQRPNYEWDGKISSINSEIEVGTLYVLNCGHGSKSSITLNSQSPSLYTSSLAEKLSNNNLYPIFFNMSCSTGSYEHLSYPSLTQSLIGGKYGAVAVYSASEYSCMGLNDAMAIGYFNGLWTKPGFNCQIEEFYDYYSQPEYKNTPTTLGKILEYGQLMQTAHYGLKSKFSVYNKRIFHLFGDPSMLVHTVIPNLITTKDLNLVVNPVTSIDITSGKIQKALPNTGDVEISLSKHSRFFISILDTNNKSVRFYGNSAQMKNALLPVTITIYGNNLKPFSYKYGFSPTDAVVPEEFQLTIRGISPNPMKEQAKVSIRANSTSGEIFEHYKNVVIQLFTSNGEYKKRYSLPKNESEIIISSDGLKPGLYLVVLEADGIRLDSKKLVVE